MHIRVERILLLQKLAEFNGPAREKLALRQAAKLLSIAFDDDPVSRVERRQLDDHLRRVYKGASIEFRGLYQEVNLHFVAELKAAAAELEKKLDELNALSIKIIHHHNGLEQ